MSEISVRRRTKRGVVFSERPGNLLNLPASSDDGANPMVLSVERCPGGAVALRLSYRVEHGHVVPLGWVELSQDDLPHLMRVLML